MMLLRLRVRIHNHQPTDSYDEHIYRGSKQIIGSVEEDSMISPRRSTGTRVKELQLYRHAKDSIQDKQLVF